MSRLLLESPWPLLIALAAVAVGVFLVGSRRDDDRLRWLAAAPLVLGAGVFALAWGVTTDRERLEARTLALAEAVADPFDLEAVRELTAEDARLLRWDREQMIRIARHAADRVTVDRYAVTDLKVGRVSDRYGRTYIAARGRVESRLGGGAFKTDWMLRWRKDGAGRWRLSEVEKVRVNDRHAERILASLLN